MSVLPLVYMCMPGEYVDQKRELDPLKLDKVL